MSSRITEGLDRALRAYLYVPDHVAVCASMVRYDLMYGPAYARLPAAGIETIGDDDLYSLYEDAADDCAEGDSVVEVYSSIVAETLRAFIADLPSTLYYDDECGFVTQSEPEGEWLESEEEGSEPEWCEPSPCYSAERADIVRALFGSTIAREFA